MKELIIILTKNKIPMNKFIFLIFLLSFTNAFSQDNSQSLVSYLEKQLEHKRIENDSLKNIVIKGLNESIKNIQIINWFISFFFIVNL